MKRKDWICRDLKYNWHPYTQMRDCEDLPPILIGRAKGIKLYDEEGNFYYDTISSWWCNVHGHNHPRINRAIKKQLSVFEHIPFAGFTHRAAIELAERLVSLTPKSLKKIFFSDDGSTAVETALKMSLQFWQNTGRKGKTKFLSLDHGYHGDTVGAMSVSAIGLFNKIFSPLLFDSIRAPSPYCYRCPLGKTRQTCAVDCAGNLENIITARSRELAALIIEPMVMAAGGMIIYPGEYLERAARACKKYGIHLIVDEVATGFGRTGKMFACEHAGVEPDFMCMSKGLTAGYLPMGVTLASEEVYKAFYADFSKKRTFYHGHTYTANPLGCAAALESLDIFRDERIMEKAAALSSIFGEGLDRFRDHPHVGDIRHIGMIGALELVKNKKTKKPFRFEDRVGYEIYKKGLRENLILRPLGNVVYLFMPLSIKAWQIEDILGRISNILASNFQP